MVGDSSFVSVDTNVVSVLIDRLRARKQTIGLAESCTAGLLSATLGGISGVSDVYLGAVVAYSNQAKVDLLSVAWNSLKTDGAVSETVARQMAAGIRNQLKCHWSVSITGIAGPTGGSPQKPVGTVWLAVSGPGFEEAELHHFPGDRIEVQTQSVNIAVGMLLKAIG
jgi:nicotinamide-nucleotide amidase